MIILDADLDDCGTFLLYFQCFLYVELYESVIAANHVEDQTKRMLKIKKLLHELPEHNFETFNFIAQHLNLVASHELTNKVKILHIGCTIIQSCVV